MILSLLVPLYQTHIELDKLLNSNLKLIMWVFLWDISTGVNKFNATWHIYVMNTTSISLRNINLDIEKRFAGLFFFFKSLDGLLTYR